MHAELSGKGSALASMGMGHGAALGIGIRKRRRTCLAELAKAAWPAPGATLDLDFVNNQGYIFGRGIASALSLIEFTRGSGECYTNSAGALTNAAVNEAVIDFDPVTLLSKGMPEFEQRTNLYSRSQEFDSAPWANARASITPNVTTAPDNTATADKLVEDSTASSSHYHYANSVTYTAGQVYTKSLFLKAAERTAYTMAFPSAGFTIEQRVTFNLSAGTFNVDAGSVTAKIKPWINGWYRCIITATATTTVTTTDVLGYLNNGSLTYSGDGASGLYPWGAQLEAAANEGPYIPTGASQVTRSASFAKLTGATFSALNNQMQGLWVIEYLAPPDFASFPTVLSAWDGASSEYWIMGHSSGGAVRLERKAGGVAASAMNTTVVTAGALVKAAASYAINDFALSANGNTPVTSASGNTPANTQVRIGGYLGSPSSMLNSHIRRVIFYPIKPQNTAIPASSAP